MIDSQRGAQRQVGYNHFISNKPEWNNCFIKNTPKILDKSSGVYFVRRNRMLQCIDNFRFKSFHDMSRVYQKVNCQILRATIIPRQVCQIYTV